MAWVGLRKVTHTENLFCSVLLLCVSNNLRHRNFEQPQFMLSAQIGAVHFPMPFLILQKMNWFYILNGRVLYYLTY